MLLTVWATNVEQLMVLRFIGGIGMGGIVPIAYTLVSEYAPRRMRSTVTVITNAGYSVGAALTGLVAAPVDAALTAGNRCSWSAPALSLRHGGRADRCCLPESPLFLAHKRPDSPKLRRAVRAAPAGEPLDPDARFVAHDPQERAGQPGEDNLFAAVPRAARLRPRRCCGCCSSAIRSGSSFWRAGCRW